MGTHNCTVFWEWPIFFFFFTNILIGRTINWEKWFLIRKRLFAEPKNHWRTIIFTTVQSLLRFIIDAHRWLVNIIGTKLHENRMAQSITEEKREQILPLTHIGCFIYRMCFWSVRDIIWTRHVSLPQLMLDSDIEACTQLLNCKPVDTQIMGICFHKRTNLMGTRKVIQHRRAALHQNRWMCFYALFIPLNGILFKTC